MRDYSELEAILMNPERLEHLQKAGEWLEFAAIAVAVPVTLTTMHATLMNYYRASEFNSELGRNETWEDTINNVFQSMVMTATGKSRLMVTQANTSSSTTTSSTDIALQNQLTNTGITNDTAVGNAVASELAASITNTAGTTVSNNSKADNLSIIENSKKAVL